ncbi:MAG: LysE family translocator [Pseudomonadota bacterium]
MTFEIWLAFAAASTALLVIPGPTLMMVLSYALSDGRRVAVASALRVATGDLIAMTLSVIGLGAILLTSALAFTVLKWVGAVYLVYLGVRMILSARGASSTLTGRTPGQSPGRVFRDLTTVTALNPKSNTFFIAFVPQFIDPGAAYAPQAGILIATFVGIAAINALVFALAATLLRSQITRPRVQAWLTRAGGATLIGMGALTATLRRAT